MGAAMRPAHRLIVALDVTDAGRARSVAEAVRGHVDAIKVNWPLVLSGGLGLVREFSDLGYGAGTKTSERTAVPGGVPPMSTVW